MALCVFRIWYPAVSRWGVFKPLKMLYLPKYAVINPSPILSCSLVHFVHSHRLQPPFLCFPSVVRTRGRIGGINHHSKSHGPANSNKKHCCKCTFSKIILSFNRINRRWQRRGISILWKKCWLLTPCFLSEMLATKADITFVQKKKVLSLS